MANDPAAGPKLVRGRLGTSALGFTMPSDAPLYPTLPVHFRNTSALAVSYETDEDAALSVLPDCLEISRPAVATIVFVRYCFSTLGSYDEAFLFLRTNFEGQRLGYVVYNVLTSDSALAVGREVFGIPKKLGRVSIVEDEQGILAAVERPKDNVICTCIVRPEKPTGGNGQRPFPLACLRILPGIETGQQPTVHLITHDDPVDRDWQTGSGWTEWSGVGSVSFPAASQLDPWHKFKVLRIRSATYSFGPSSFKMTHGRILKAY